MARNNKPKPTQLLPIGQGNQIKDALLVFHEGNHNGEVMSVYQFRAFYRKLSHHERELCFTVQVDPSMVDPVEQELRVQALVQAESKRRGA
jgi:hypothetical protein